MFKEGDKVIIRRPHCERQRQGRHCPEAKNFQTPYCTGHKGIIKYGSGPREFIVTFPILDGLTCSFDVSDFMAQSKNEEFE